MKIKRDSDSKEDKNLKKEVKSYSKNLIRVRDERDAVMVVNKSLEKEIQSLEDQKENLFEICKKLKLKCKNEENGETGKPQAKGEKQKSFHVIIFASFARKMAK